MQQRTFNCLAAISLALATTSIIQWLASPTGGQTWHFTTDSADDNTQKNFDLIFSRGIDFSVKDNHWTRWTIGQITIPFLLPVGLFAMVPIAWLLQLRRLTPIGRCKMCGYDLRATPERCPECGIIPDKT